MVTCKAEDIETNINPLYITLQSQSRSQSQNHVTTDCQSFSVSRCRAPYGSHDQMFVTV
jgi:hypothetical protein